MLKKALWPVSIRIKIKVKIKTKNNKKADVECYSFGCVFTRNPIIHLMSMKVIVRMSFHW